MSSLLANCRFALRSLRREPGYALAFVVTLGLGIGANSAIFSLVNGVLLRPLPYPDAARIVYLKQPAAGRGAANIAFSFTEIQDYREQASTVDEIVEFGDWTFNVLDRGDPHRANGGLVTANFFDVLGMRPLHGRLLEPADRERGAEPVAVLTHDYWLRCCGGDPAVIGQPLNLTRKVATIVGVLAPGAHYATQRGQDLYVNYAANDHYVGASMEEDRSHRMTDVFARLSPEVTVDQARADLAQIAARLHAQYPEGYPASWGLGIEVVPWQEELTREARPTLLMLLGTAAFVLLIACANVANLTLTRLNRREHELTIRAAVGAGERRLRGLLLAETGVLALAGAALGLLVAYAGLDLLVAYVARFTTRIGEIAIDPMVLAFTLAVALAAAVGFAMVPGLGFSGGLAGVLVTGGGHATAGRARRRWQRGLVVGQVALSFMLLVGAGLLLRTLMNLYAVDPGYELESVLRLEAPNFAVSTPEEERQFAEALIGQVESHAGVHSAAMANTAPLGGATAYGIYVQVEGMSEEDARAASTPTLVESITPGYFRTLAVPLLQGRTFDLRDNADGEPVAIVNETFARQHLDGQSGVGKRLAYTYGGQFNAMRTVVGVVADTRVTSLRLDPVPAIYLPTAQVYAVDTLLVRADGATGLAPQVVEDIRSLDPERPVEHVETLAEIRAGAIAPQRLNATLLALFAVLALAIAGVGIAGVLAYSVSQRTREFGIRVALGADRGRVLGQVLGEGGTLALLGLVLGAAGAVALTRLLGGFLFGVRPLDPLTFGAVAVVLLAVAGVASALPARRATGVDPMVALRSE